MAPCLADYVAAAAEVLGASEDQIERLPQLTLAESALASPFAGFGGEDAYPGLELKGRCCLSGWSATTRSQTETSAPPWP